MHSSAECFSTLSHMTSPISPSLNNLTTTSLNELPKANHIWYSSNSNYHLFYYNPFLFISFFSFQDYYDDDKLGVRYPNFNFNVSHHGHYVAIASEPLCLVGIDIVSYAVPSGETVAEFIQCFSSYFSSLEWDNIANAGTCDDDVLTEFYRYCYTKSI